MEKVKTIITIYNQGTELMEIEADVNLNVGDEVLFKHKVLEYVATVESKIYNVEENTIYIAAMYEFTEYDYMAMAEYDRWMEKD